MAEVLRLSSRLPPSSPIRRWNGQRSTGRASIVSSAPFSSSCSSLIYSVVAAPAATSSSWNVEEEGKTEGENIEEQFVGDMVGPVSIELETISDEERFDQINKEAETRGAPFVVLWMAHWCRKCIYLKPKLERLAASYHPSVQFYSVDVNSVPHKLVKRAGVTRMPTIQIWKNSTKQAEVIGGHKAWQVVNDVRQMIENALLS